MPKNLFHIFPGKFRESRGIVGVIERNVVRLTTAQIKALNTTPITIVPAPGAGRFIQVIGIATKINYATTQYTGANAMEFRYTNGSGAKVSGDVAAAFINSASTRLDTAVPVAQTSVTANAPVVVSVPVGNPAAGDSPMVIDVLYRVVRLI